MKNLSVFFVGIALSSLSFAQANKINPASFFNMDSAAAEFDIEALEGAFNLDGKMVPMAPAHPCSQIKLTPDQNDALKKAFVAFKRASIQDKADLDIAKLDYLVTLSDTKSTKGAATTNSDALATAIADMTKSHLNFVNGIVYDVLTVDQREPALHCMAVMHHMNAMMKLKKACDKFNHHPRPNPKPAPKPEPPIITEPPVAK